MQYQMTCEIILVCNLQSSNVTENLNRIEMELHKKSKQNENIEALLHAL